MSGYTKILSPNELGDTGSHQAGIVVSKKKEILDFFPKLAKEKNPSSMLNFIDDEGKSWAFKFTYYNGGLYGQTRNEYRLTGMTGFFKANKAKPGDELLIGIDAEGRRTIKIQSQSKKNKAAARAIAGQSQEALLSHWTPKPTLCLEASEEDRCIRERAAIPLSTKPKAATGTRWDEAESSSAPPAAENLCASIRSIGYTLASSLCDLIDNCISAGAGNIDLRADRDGASGEWTLSVADDGIGMDEKTLEGAMTLASRPPGSRASTDLGQFGMGLKTASLAMGRRVTLRTRSKGEALSAVLDIDRLSDPEKKTTWLIHHQAMASSEPWLRENMPTGDGTIVLVENMDAMLHPAISDDDGNKLIDEAMKHVRTTFHRFMEREDSPIAIRINGTPLTPIDPAFSENSHTINLPTKRLAHGGSLAQARGVCVAHPDELSAQEAESMASGLASKPGFQIYRAGRLICSGATLGVDIQNWAKADYAPHVRVIIDIGNDSDAMWGIDVMKSKAMAPAHLRPELKKIINLSAEAAKAMFAKRSPAPEPSETKSDEPSLWLTTRKSEGPVHRIDRKHPAVLGCAEKCSDKKAFEALLQSVEACLPIERIFVSSSKK